MAEIIERKKISELPGLDGSPDPSPLQDGDILPGTRGGTSGAGIFRAVKSVNGQTGPDVVIDAGDLGAAPEGHGHSLADIADAGSAAGSDVADFEPAGAAAAAVAPLIARRLVLNIEDFGPTGDGVADDTAAFLAFRSHVIQTLGDGTKGPDALVTLELRPGRHYTYTNNRWVMGIPRLRLNANGAKLECTANEAFAVDNRALNWQNFEVDTGFTIRTNPEPRDYGHLMADTPAGQPVVTLALAVDAAEYAPGDVVVISGFSNYNTGAPPEYRWFEFREVASADTGTGTVTLTENLSYGYDADWPVSHQDVFNGDDLGPPRILKLERANRPLSRYVEMNDAVFIPNRNALAQARLTLAGVLDFVLNRCDMTAMLETTMGEARSTILTACLLGNVEGDKWADIVVFNDCDVSGEFSNFVGTKRVVWNRGRIQSEEIGVGPRIMEWNSPHFDGSLLGGAGDEVMRAGYVAGRRVERLSIRNPLVTGVADGTMILNPNDAFMQTGKTLTFDALGTGDELLVDIATDYNDLDSIYPGMTLSSLDGTARCRVTRIVTYAADPAKAAIEVVWLTAVPAAPVTLAFLNVRDFICEGVAGVNADPGWRQERGRLTLRYGRGDPLWRDDNVLDFSWFGFVEEIVVNVWKPGDASSPTLWIRNQSIPQNYAQIDMQTPGGRRFTPWGFDGLGTDSHNAGAFSSFTADLRVTPRTGGTSAWTSAEGAMPEFEIAVAGRSVLS